MACDPLASIDEEVAPSADRRAHDLTQILDVRTRRSGPRDRMDERRAHVQFARLDGRAAANRRTTCGQRLLLRLVIARHISGFDRSQWRDDAWHLNFTRSEHLARRSHGVSCGIELRLVATIGCRRFVDW